MKKPSAKGRPSHEHVDDPAQLMDELDSMEEGFDEDESDGGYMDWLANGDA